MTGNQQDMELAPRGQSALPATVGSPQALLELALTNGAGMDTIERLTALLERAQEKEAERALWAALARAQREFPPIFKTKSVDEKYKYAPLDEIMSKVMPILALYGLSCTFNRDFVLDGAERTVAVSSSLVIHHAAGHTHTFPPVTMPIEALMSSNNKRVRSDAQEVGVAMTYADRYAYQGGLGLRPTDEDTDGAAPSQPYREPQCKSAAAQPAQPATATTTPQTAPEADAPDWTLPGWQERKVTGAEPKKGRNDKTYWRIEVDGSGWITTFHASIYDRALRAIQQTGGILWLRFEERGSYTNIVDAAFKS